MDELVKKAFEFAEHMTVLTNQKNLIKEEFNQNLTHYEFGGSFTITKDFLNFVYLLLVNNQKEDVVLIDDNAIPVRVANLDLFFQTVLSKYVEATNEYYTKYTNLTNQRKLEKLIDIND